MKRLFGFCAQLKGPSVGCTAGAHATMGLNVIRTGVKVAAVDPTGKLPIPPRFIRLHRRMTQRVHRQASPTRDPVFGKARRDRHGTASRETDSLVQTLCKEHPELGLRSIVVSEAGASVYSASELKRQPQRWMFLCGVPFPLHADYKTHWSTS